MIPEQLTNKKNKNVHVAQKEYSAPMRSSGRFWAFWSCVFCLACFGYGLYDLNLRLNIPHIAWPQKTKAMPAAQPVAATQKLPSAAQASTTFNVGQIVETFEERTPYFLTPTQTHNPSGHFGQYMPLIIKQIKTGWVGVADDDRILWVKANQVKNVNGS